MTGVTVEDVSDSYALIAVQGLRHSAIVGAHHGSSRISAIPWDEQRPYGWTDAIFDGAPLLIARTGYTGEDGFELLIRHEHAAGLWRSMLAAGEAHGLVPAGLAARDTLRLEAGMPLYGHELSREIVPAQAGLGGVIPADKTDFIGEAAKIPRAEHLCSSGSSAMVNARAGPVTPCCAARNEWARSPVARSAPLSAIRSPWPSSTRPPSSADDLTLDVRGTQHRRHHDRIALLQEEEMTDLNALAYTSEHEWVAVANGIATIGITDYAAEQLGDIVYVDLPADNATLTSGQVMGELESTKSVSELFAPVDGEVIELNGQVDVDPALVNRDPFGEGWLVRVAAVRPAAHRVARSRRIPPADRR